MSGERTGSHVTRRKHAPDDPALGREADIDTVFVDLAVIALGVAVRALEDAGQILRRAEDEANATGDVTRQGADIDVARGLPVPWAATLPRTIVSAASIFFIATPVNPLDCSDQFSAANPIMADRRQPMAPPHPRARSHLTPS